MASLTPHEGRRETDFEQAVMASYSALRSAFISGLHGDLHVPIPAPGFLPPVMPTWQVVHSMLFQVDADGALLVDLLRVLVRASESADPMLCGMAQRLIAQMAREHAQMHKEEHAQGVSHA